jgi:hypothetical protein
LAERLDSRNRIAGPPKTSWTYYGNNLRLLTFQATPAEP